MNRKERIIELEKIVNNLPTYEDVRQLRAEIRDLKYEKPRRLKMKKDEGKYKPSLIYTSLLQEVSKVREYGIQKHGASEDWRTTPMFRHLNAAIRHIRAIMDGQHFDSESSLLHLAHAATNIMFEIERFYGFAEMDDYIALIESMAEPLIIEDSKKS